VIAVSTFCNIDCGLAAFSRETESPARFACSTLLFAVLKSGDAFGVFLAGSPLVGAFLLDALLGVSEGNGSRYLFDGDNSVTSVGGGAFCCVDCGLAALSRETKSPTGLLCSTFLLAVLESGETFGVLLAVSILGWALLLDALGRISKGNSGGNLIQAIVIDNTCPKISGVSITLFSKTCGVASGIIDTFFFAILKSWEAF
jgi:hypothetical protein